MTILLAAGCAKSGMGEAVRTDINARMESARGQTRRTSAGRVSTVSSVYAAINPVQIRQ